MQKKKFLLLLLLLLHSNPPPIPHQRHTLHKTIPIIIKIRLIPSIHSNRKSRPHRIQIIHTHSISPSPSTISTVFLQTKNPTLTSRPFTLIRACSIIIQKKRIQPGSIDENFLRVENAQAPAVGGGNHCEISWASVDDGGVGEGRVGEGGDGGEGVAGVGVGLVVGGFGLDLAGVDGAGLGELVFVADVAVGGGRLVMMMENEKGKKGKGKEKKGEKFTHCSTPVPTIQTGPWD